MDIKELKNTIDNFCRAMKLIEEKSNADADLVEPARAEIAFFGMYIIFDEGSFDEEELGLVEEAAGFKINRNHWNEIMELGRVDSEKNYLSQPPNTFTLMLDVDNLLYEAGEELSAYNAGYEVYKLVGDVLTNIKGFTDEKRQAKLDRFIKMLEDYRRENSKAPEIRDNSTQEKIVIPSKKGVQAPKKS
ncbi:hypothetical protein [Butyrivibrio sp. NC2007]|uniref:hypothetical protein n=1 Tax=Butyrivibrio sp. NC2007 TaxID=1280683 RepID=UPI0003B3CF5E|nr:hypothetical protein [Butyrivibrio sp. NC2007]